MEKKVNKLYKKYDENIILADTGEFKKFSDIILEYESCKRDDEKLERIKKYKIMKSNIGYKIKDDRRNWMMIYQQDISDMKLTIEEKGVYISLIEKLALDGTCRIHTDHTSFKGYGEEFGISKNRIKGILEGLMNKKLIWFDCPTKILINPKYYRYGNHVRNLEAVKIFDVEIEGEIIKDNKQGVINE